jgi:PleD family two-component response regulator
MGGRISVDSEIDKGSKFVCNLSLKISTQKKLTVSKTKEYPKLTEKKAILLIEDSELIQLSILKILSSDGNFFLNIVSNGEDVVEYVKNIKPDLIIVSNTIQKFSAETITKNIKSLPRQFKRIPVLALSTEVFKEDIKRFKEAGIKDVIAKPFNKEDILDKLYKYLKK